MSNLVLKLEAQFFLYFGSERPRVSNTIRNAYTVSVKLVLIYQKQGVRAETEVCVKKYTIYHTIEVEWDV